MPINEADAQQAIQKLNDEGKLVEAGWLSYRILVMPAEVGAVQLDETRKAFFAGAHHLFGSIMTILEPDAEPTEADMRRMDLIHQELQKFMAGLRGEKG